MPKKRKNKRIFTNLGSPFDPNGSYTGISVDGKYEKPVQDADDL